MKEREVGQITEFVLCVTQHQIYLMKLGRQIHCRTHSWPSIKLKLDSPCTLCHDLVFLPLKIHWSLWLQHLSTSSLLRQLHLPPTSGFPSWMPATSSSSASITLLTVVSSHSILKSLRWWKGEEVWGDGWILGQLFLDYFTNKF